MTKISYASVVLLLAMIDTNIFAQSCSWGITSANPSSCGSYNDALPACNAGNAGSTSGITCQYNVDAEYECFCAPY
ncbi:MAG: hypothetical protein Q7U04_05710 [Bacteriovorax sp.]|nr:hypothetical protein [Bacteriovorax sp.]